MFIAVMESLATLEHETANPSCLINSESVSRIEIKSSGTVSVDGAQVEYVEVLFISDLDGTELAYGYVNISVSDLLYILNIKHVGNLSI